MSMSQDKVENLGTFIQCVTKIRHSWDLAKHKELWFRGESKDYGETILRPELYRPATAGVPLKPIWKLLKIENDLYDEFRRNAVVRSDEKTSEEGLGLGFLLSDAAPQRSDALARLVRRRADGFALRAAQQGGR